MGVKHQVTYLLHSTTLLCFEGCQYFVCMIHRIILMYSEGCQYFVYMIHSTILVYSKGCQYFVYMIHSTIFVYPDGCQCLYIYSCNLPPGLLAEWQGSLTCYCRNTVPEDSYRKFRSAVGDPRTKLKRRDEKLNNWFSRSPGHSLTSCLTHFRVGLKSVSCAQFGWLEQGHERVYMSVQFLVSVSERKFGFLFGVRSCGLH